MIGATGDIHTADGPMATLLCHPEQDGRFSAVCFLMDAHGIREELRDMARRLATVGYYVRLPHLYCRAGRDTIFGADVMEEGSPEHTPMRAVHVTMTIPPVMCDVAALLAFVERQDAVTPGPVGCHGYCMSGPYALAASARYPAPIAATDSSCGTWLVSEAEESPHRSLGHVTGELSIACAEHDALAARVAEPVDDSRARWQTEPRVRITVISEHFATRGMSRR